MATGTSYRTPSTLPPQTSGFVGRAAELARTRALLRGSRLVTITGPGGVGKTRLAVRAAGEAAGDYRDGVHFIELSTVRDPELLVHTLAAGFTIAEHPGAEPDQLDRLLGYLRDRELLIILDTCEQVIDASATLADTILREAPGVTILATSRQPLDAAGEFVHQLCPLPVPDADSATPGEADAVELFAQRAAAAVPGFAVTPENLADVITVCRRLDGIPLGIELATVRLRALPLHEMAERIGDRLRLLTGERRSGTPRHQTLRAAIEWSHDLCTPAERLLWARLSVFAGGFGIEDAEEVCADGELARAEIVPALISLVDKSLVVRDSAPQADRAEAGDPPVPTFRMLDTIREFGAERLHLADTRAVVSWRASRAEWAGPERDSPEIGRAKAAVRGRFIAHYLALAEEFERDPVTGQLGKLQRLLREHPNLRAAFEYALDLPGNDSAAIVLATSLCIYWQITSQLREAEYWLDQVLARCPKRSVVRARVLSVRGYIRILLGDFANGSADAEAAIAMAAPFSDLAAAARGSAALHIAFTNTRNLAAAQAAANIAVECFTGLGDALGLANLDMVDGLLRLQTGELALCFDAVTRGLDRLPEDEVWCSSYLHGLRSLVLFLRGDLAGAKSAGVLSLLMKRRVRDEMGTAFGLSSLAFMAAGEGRCERAAWLFGSSAPLWERAGRWYLGNTAFEALHEVAERIACESLGDERYWKLRAAGSAAPLDHAIERAVADADELGEPAARP